MRTRQNRGAQILNYYFIQGELTSFRMDHNKHISFLRHDIFDNNYVKY